MESLPDIAVEGILAFLNAKDLLSCSLVSVYWRQAINNDRIWKKLCYRECDTETVNYVQLVQSRIEPVFVEPVSSHLRLEDLCYWRVVHLKLMHLKRNLYFGNYNVKNISKLFPEGFTLKIVMNMLIAIVDGAQCKVWNIYDSLDKVETVNYALKNTRLSIYIHLRGNSLIIVQDSLLQVYYKYDETFKLQFRRLYTQKEEDSKHIPESLYIDEWYNETVKERPSTQKIVCIGKYLVGLAKHENIDQSWFLHVWDVTSGRKVTEHAVKELVCPDSANRIMVYSSDSKKQKSQKIFLYLQNVRENSKGDNETYNAVHVYNLADFTIKRLFEFEPVTPYIYCYNNVVVLLDNTQKSFNIYDSSDGHKIISKTYENIINFDSVQVRDTFLGFTIGNDLFIVEVNSFNVVFTTNFTKFSSHLFGFDFLFLDWNLILISQWDGLNTIEVWSVEENRCLNTLKACGLMFPGSTIANLCFWNEMVTSVQMLEFW